MYPTSKTFVDMQMREKESIILDRFVVLNNTFVGNIPLTLIRYFVKNNFKLHTLRNWLPPDFKNHPKIIDYIQDNNYKLLFK